MKKTIALIPDSRPQVGFGHISRMTTLADALARIGMRPVLLLGRKAPRLVLDHGRWTIRRGADPVKTSLRLRASLVVLDGYGMPRRLAPMLTRAGVKVACLDDMGLPPLPLSLVVNPNAHAHKSLYPRLPCLLGPRYALLRTTIRAAREQPRHPTGLSLLVCMGGADPDGRTLTVLDALEQVTGQRPVELTIIMGPATDPALLQRVRDKAAGLPKATVLHAPGDFVDRLAGATLAVVSGGVVLTETIFLGVAAVALILADNQTDTVNAWHQAGAITIGAPQSTLLAQQLADLLDDPQKRAEQTRRGQRLLDGRGAQRVAARLAKCLKSC